jgi:hypothetical protein
MSSARLLMDNGRKHNLGYIPLSIASWQPPTLFYSIIPLLPTKELYFRQALISHPPEFILNLLKLSIFPFLIPYSQTPNSPLHLTTLTPHLTWISYFTHSSVILFTHNITHLAIAIQNNYVFIHPRPIVYNSYISCRLRSFSSARH